MYELQSLRETLTRIAALKTKEEHIQSEANRKALKEQYPMDLYPAMYGQLSAEVISTAFDAQRALRALDAIEAAVGPMERLYDLMYNMDLAGEREVRLLESISQDDYTHERHAFLNNILGALREVEESEWECEVEDAKEVLVAAGFAEVQRDDFEGLERGDERVTIEMQHERRIPRSPAIWTGYVADYSKGGQEFLRSTSGGIAEMVTAILSPVSVSESQPNQQP